eukprot:4526512-Lingulodinium_polyedra.AAC.1
MLTYGARTSEPRERGRQNNKRHWAHAAAGARATLRRACPTQPPPCDTPDPGGRGIGLGTTT